ncbi:MAG: UTP--glucose-1-phosphate uridylyltransferase, partial [Opitutales bacterium]
MNPDFGNSNSPGLAIPADSLLVRALDTSSAAENVGLLEEFGEKATVDELLREAAALHFFARREGNGYKRVRALLYLYALYRFYLPGKEGLNPGVLLPHDGHLHLLNRRYEEAIEVFLRVQRSEGAADSLASALAAACQGWAFQILAGQVQRSVRAVPGNQWMFRMGHSADHPLRLRPELIRKSGADAAYPVLRERTAVRMDLSHSGWSDIFFLGMDYPEGARVLNISIDLAVLGRDKAPLPPVQAFFRVIDEPLLRLTSVDLATTAEITELSEVFDFAKDYLGLLKAAVIASGIVPPGMEGSGQSLPRMLAGICGRGRGRGIELVSQVNDIPKGSRLAVSTNLLGSLISICMRATGQIRALTGAISEEERRIIAARAILGEWIGGSGGGWQDSGGVWPGIKVIEGALAKKGDVEHGSSRGRLLPKHTILDSREVSEQTRRKLQESLVLVHGGLSQNVGPILEMVTEKYLIGGKLEWEARQRALEIFRGFLDALRVGDVQ